MRTPVQRLRSDRMGRVKYLDLVALADGFAFSGQAGDADEFGLEDGKQGKRSHYTFALCSPMVSREDRDVKWGMEQYRRVAGVSSAIA